MPVKQVNRGDARRVDLRMPALGAFLVIARNSYDEKPSLEGLTDNVALYWESDACRVSSQVYYNANITLY